VSDDGERVAILRGRELVVRDLWSAIVTADGVTIRSPVNGAEGPTFDGPLPGGETVTQSTSTGG